MTKKQQIYIRPPFAGAIVRDPETGKALPGCGAWVTATPHWRRQIKMGEVVVCEPPKIPKKKADAEKGDNA